MFSQEFLGLKLEIMKTGINFCTLCCIVFFQYASAAIDFPRLFRYLAQKNGVRIPALPTLPTLPTDCEVVAHYRYSCVQSCIHINLSPQYCPPRTRKWGCYKCLPPFAYRSRKGICIPKLECELENRVFRQRVVTLTPPTIPSGSNLTNSEATILPGDARCTGNRIFSRCARCEVPCSRRRYRNFCFALCRQGCICRPGYFRNANNECVPRELCDARTTEARTPPPTTTTTTTTTTAAPLTPRFPVVFTPPPPTLPPVACPSVLTYTSCVQCERTCDRPDNSNCNSQFCTRGCTCPLGLVRGNNRCLRLSECPSQVTTPPPIPPALVCPNGFFQGCIECEQTCDNLFSVCTSNACNLGCICPPGLVRRNNLCITRSACFSGDASAISNNLRIGTTPAAITTTPAVVCSDPNTVLEKCSRCERTCENRFTHIDCSVLQPCQVRCVCRHGMMKKGSECVLLSNC